MKPTSPPSTLHPPTPTNKRKKKRRRKEKKNNFSDVDSCPLFQNFNGWTRVAGYRVHDLDNPGLLQWTTLVIRAQDNHTFRVLLYDITADYNEVEGLENPYKIFDFGCTDLPSGVTTPGLLYCGPTGKEKTWSEVEVFDKDGKKVSNLIPIVSSLL